MAVITARPGRIKKIVDVDLPSRRDGDVRSTLEFARIRHALWQLLGEEVEKTAAQASVNGAATAPGRRPRLLGTLFKTFAREVA